MKSNKNNMDLEQLLADVEHAGRDARRREQLSTMIDNMAGEAGSRKNAHGFWWWSARVAAAACVLFFISTAIRIWFIPTESHEPLVAEVVTPPSPPQGGTAGTDRIPQGGTAGTDRIPQGGTAGADRIPQGGTESLALIDSTIAAPVRPVAPRRVIVHRNVAPTVEEETEPIEEVTLPLIEELIAEEIESQEVEPVEEAEESALETIVAPVVSVAYVEPIAVAQADTPLPPSRGDVEQPRRSILASLFRQPEPDDMTGTVLAFRIL